MKKILVIEDKDEEKVKARVAVEKSKHYCFVAGDLQEALLLLGQEEKIKGLDEKIKWDGIITDLHFPLLFGDKAEPYGLEIAILADKLGIPCVICTDLGHHFTDWIDRVAKRLGIEVVGDKGCEGIDAWGKAMRLFENKL